MREALFWQISPEKRHETFHIKRFFFFLGLFKAHIQQAMSLFKDSAASADGRKAETQVLELVSKFHQSFFLHRHKNLLTINSWVFFNQINNFPHLKNNGEK